MSGWVVSCRIIPRHMTLCRRVTIIVLASVVTLAALILCKVPLCTIGAAHHFYRSKCEEESRIRRGLAESLKQVKRRRERMARVSYSINYINYVDVCSYHNFILAEEEGACFSSGRES